MHVARSRDLIRFLGGILLDVSGVGYRFGMALRWLHLTDLHIGRPDEAQRVAIRSLVETVAGVLGSQPIDAVFLTGDLAYSGEKREYDDLQSLVVDPLRKLPAVLKARFIAVPGNHDLDCRVTAPMPWATLGGPRQHVFFQDTDEGRQVRSPRANGFIEYSHFLGRAKIEGLDPLKHCAATTQLRGADGSVVEVVGINTALFSDRYTTDEHNAPAPTHAVRARLDGIDKSTRTLVLAHHPITWFLHPTQEPLKSLLYQRRVMYLHGHEHKVKVETTKRGIRSLGFGAAYQGSLDDTRVSSYVNSFAVGVLDAELHIAIYSWDAEHGAWRPRMNLPAEFDQVSSVLSEGYVFPLASEDGDVERSASDTATPSERPRVAPMPTKAYLLEGPLTIDAWFWILKLAELVPDQAKCKSTDVAGRPSEIADILISDGDSTLHARCIAGQGHVLSAREVETENTRMDTEGHRAVVILTMGDIADDARRLALQLNLRKSFQTCAQLDVAKRLNSRLPSKTLAHLEQLDAAEGLTAHVLGAQRWFVLVQDRLRSSWFYLVDASGEPLDASHDAVASLRKQRPELSSVRYGRDDSEVSGPTVLQPFDRETYLSKCKLEFHTLKYDALAALGLRLPNASVQDVYVPASADVGDGTSSSTAYRQAINDILDSLNLDDAQRAQLESQLREGVPTLGLKETGAARSLYQQYGNVIVLGDPGSGKTCFLKNEVLSYCEPQTEDGWYKHHVPVFVPLIEAATLESNDILDMCAQLIARRGLPLSRPQLDELMANGHVAFFFDGLDEVAAMDRRVQLFEEIGKLITSQAPLGNRIALTSRPAAVHLMKLHKKLVPLHLRGLTDAEMRILATNVFAAEHSAGDKIRLGQLLPEEAALLERLMEDCRTNPGIRRIARNPLLLTLLVYIYRNSGPLAAKRHRVYSQAVQTLVSVRNRNARQQVLSEADLRHRLGAVALETYRSLHADIPTVEWVCEVIAKSLGRDHNDPGVIERIREFVQTVAEATGLLVIHKKEVVDRSRVTFLHHSFLEYYAAVGFLETGTLDTLPAVATNPRWREVIAVISGLLADQSDSTKLIRTLIGPVDDGDKITLDRLYFAFDCALEADVPTEETQQLLADAVADAMAGPGLVDQSVRTELADRIGRLLAASGSPSLNTLLAEKVTSADKNVVAAYVDLIGYISKRVELEPKLVHLLKVACTDGAPEVRTVIFGAIERVQQLRGAEAIAALREGLQGSVPMRYAAVRTLDAVPALTKDCWAHAKACLGDPQAAISGTAARALMAAGVNVDLSERADRAFLETCLRQWARITDAEDVYQNQLRTSRPQLDELLSSPIPEDRMLGLRLLPLLVREERYVHERIMDVVNGKRERGELVAALESLRLSRGALALLTIADVDVLGDLLESEFRDVRSAAASTIAAHPSPDNSVTRLLRDYAKGTKGSEFRNALRALVQVANDDPQSRSFIFDLTQQRITHALDHTFGDDTEQRDLQILLKGCEDLGGEGAERLEGSVARLAASYKAPKALRRRALQTLARVSQASAGRINYFIEILNGDDHVLGAVVGLCVVDFVRSCRLRVDDVREIVPELDRLDDALVRRWQRIMKAQKQLRLDTPSLRGLRIALREVRELVIAYSEFATRRLVGS